MLVGYVNCIKGDYQFNNMAELHLNYRCGSSEDYKEINEFLKLDDQIDFSILEKAFEESPIYTANIENGLQKSTTYVAKIDEHDESVG